MTGQDGWWFRAQQLRDPDLAAVPVVVMSALAQVDVEAQQLGVQDYIAKPVEPEELFTILARNCR
jgi:CheY-like chemotaxis protein